MAGKRILVVEDTPMNMELIRDLLESSGFVVLEAITGEEGIQIANAEKPDLIIMDVGLPGMSGLDATRHLRNNESTSVIPVIGLSSHAMVGDDKKALEAGMNAYLTKPIDTRTFVQSIIPHLEGEEID